MFKSAIVGCGHRAGAHVAAYGQLTGGKIAACCDPDASRLGAFGETSQITSRYTAVAEMLGREHPDVLHIVTPPTARYSLMKLASDAGIPAVIVEKPLALDGDDFTEIAALADSTRTKFVVNTQLHFHPRNLELKRDVAEGRIGEVRFIEASSRYPVISQGPHIVQLVSSYLGSATPRKVLGQVSGTSNFRSNEPSPDNATAVVTFANDVRAQVTLGAENAPLTAETPAPYMHKRIAVYGTQGFVHWTMHRWERFTPDRGSETGPVDYGTEDLIAQAGLTQAVFDWLEDNRVHPNNLRQSLSETNALLGIYASALTCRTIDLPFAPTGNMLAALRRRLGEEPA